jgi:breakpoint cluster region protein
VQRFPGSELPAAWEEDVRANLSKHKQKVAVLKEELEKEQFYVEYLDRLLADVEKKKESNDIGVLKKALKDVKLVNSSGDPQHGEKGKPQQETTTLSAVEAQAKKRLSLCEDSAHKCISELSESMSEAVPSGEEDEVELRNSDTAANAGRQRSHTLSDASNYVTVIEVNGMNLRATKALSSFEPPRNNNQKAPIKKVPPKPPPKTFQYRPKDDSSSSESTGKKSNDSSLERKLSGTYMIHGVN